MPTTVTLRPGTIGQGPDAVIPTDVTGDPDTAWADDDDATYATAVIPGTSGDATQPVATIPFDVVPASATVTSAVLSVRLSATRTGGSGDIGTVLFVWTGDNIVSDAEVLLDPFVLDVAVAGSEVPRVVERDLTAFWQLFVGVGAAVGFGGFAGNAQTTTIYEVSLEVTYTARPPRRIYPRRDGRTGGGRGLVPRPRSGRIVGGYL